MSQPAIATQPPAQEQTHMTPREIVAELDKHIVGQQAAKRAVAIALRNRWRRMQISEPLRQEITPNRASSMRVNTLHAPAPPWASRAWRARAMCGAAGSSPKMFSNSGVSTGPGQSAFTRTPWRANWTPSSRDIESTAPLDAEYEICEVAAPRIATNEATLITEPPPRASRWNACPT